MVTTKLTKSNIKKIASTAEGDILSVFSMIRPLKKKKQGHGLGQCPVSTNLNHGRDNHFDLSHKFRPHFMFLVM